jgi:hypothetical protein
MSRSGMIEVNENYPYCTFAVIFNSCDHKTIIPSTITIFQDVDMIVIWLVQLTLEVTRGKKSWSGPYNRSWRPKV